MFFFNNMLNLGYLSFLKTCKLYHFNHQLPVFFKKCSIKNTIITRKASHEIPSKDNEAFTFYNMIKFRRDQAKRSILVQVQSIESYKELHSYCNAFGSINEILHYTTGNTEQMHFMIVEFNNEEDLFNIIRSSSHVNSGEHFPIHSNFLWFKALNRKAPKLKLSKNIKLSMENGNRVLPNNELLNTLLEKNNITEQIKTLHNLTKLNDVATRLRFLTTRQVEMSVSGIFPHAIAYPFGSSVNGFGKMGCDLDIVFKFSSEMQVKDESRLIFHCKSINNYERSITQRHMEVIGDLLQLFLPGCTQIRKILQARVPIIKYYQQFTDVECDLSMSNMSGVCMSDLLYLFGAIDERVRPLVFIVRKWAQEVGVTNSSPGRWISNFSLTLLVLAFLQRPESSPPILPSVHYILKQIGVKSGNVLENAEFSFSMNNMIKFKTINNDDLAILLKQFFNFYSSFDFSTKAINLNEAISITKPDHGPLYIVNPLERGLNVSKNVSLEELDKFKYELRNAAWLLESQQDKKNTTWGILELFQTKRKVFSAHNYSSVKHDRLMEVSKLFDEADQQRSKDTDKSNKNIDINSFKFEKANR